MIKTVLAIVGKNIFLKHTEVLYLLIIYMFIYLLISLLTASLKNCLTAFFCCSVFKVLLMNGSRLLKSLMSMSEIVSPVSVDKLK